MTPYALVTSVFDRLEPLNRAERARAEQSFYERHANDRPVGLPNGLGLPLAVPVIVLLVTLALLMQ